MASQALASPYATPPKLLLLAHKTDLLIRPAPPPYPSPPNIPPQTLQTATDRLRTILTREMDRLKSSRGAAGGRIEGMSKVAGSSSGLWTRLFGAPAIAEADGETEDDESLVWGGKGPFRWEDVEGVEVVWGASALGMVKIGKEAGGAQEGEQGDGLDDLKRFLWEL